MGQSFAVRMACIVLGAEEHFGPEWPRDFLRSRDYGMSGPLCPMAASAAVGHLQGHPIY
jgi:hypothetical protein